MRPTIYSVRADWDEAAGVWVAISDEVLGLAIEALTLEALVEKLRVMIPELLEANRAFTDARRKEISFELVGHWLEHL